MSTIDFRGRWRTTLLIGVTAVLFYGFASKGRAESAFVRLNQAGYISGEPKKAVLMASSATSGTFNVVNATNGATVFSAAIPANTLASWNNTFTKTYSLDFSTVTNPGIYTIQISGVATSAPVVINTAAKIYRPLLTNALFYFQSSRDGPNVITNVISRKPSHTNDASAYVYLPPVYNANDSLVGGLTNVGGGTIDVSGGWFDAGDYIKVVVTTSYVEGMMLLALRDYPALLSVNGDFRGEARYGMDWFFKMWDQTNHVLYYAVAIGDGNGGSILGDHDFWRLPEADDALNVGPPGQTHPTNSAYYVKYRPAFRAGTNDAPISPNLAGRLAASFALGSQVFRSSDPAYADRCLIAAQTVFALAKTNWTGNLLTAPPYDFYPESEWRDDLEWGAVELYFATAQTTNLPAGLLQTNASFYLTNAAYWAKQYTAAPLNLYDCGALAHYELYRAISQAGNPSGLVVTKANLVSYLNGILSSAATQSAKDAFGYGQTYSPSDDPTPHALGFAITANFYKQLTGATTYDSLALAQRDWVLGRNAWGTTFIVGAGSTFPHCMQDQIGNLSGRLDGTLPLRLGATVDGPASSLSGAGTVDGAQTCDLGSAFTTFDGQSVKYRDGAAYWMTVEPALDYTVPTILLFAQQIGELTPPVLQARPPLIGGNFQFDVAGSTGFGCVVQASTNLLNWLPLQTNVAPFSFTDSNAFGFGSRFYRAIYAH